MKCRSVFTLVCLSLTLMGCGRCSSTPVSGSNPTFNVSVSEAFPHLRFDRPLDFRVPPDETNRVFVVEQAGVVHVFENNRDVTGSAIFLDIQSKVRRVGNEEGLLGLAFHPNYKNNGYLYVNYSASNPTRSVVSRYTVSATGPNAADPTSELVILELEQPFSNHNGGNLVFGPDGYLYIGFGDGGSAGDPFSNGQNRTTLLGALLRIDVDSPSGGKNYGIPADNPLAGNTSGFREEVFAYGLRNPWRYSFDSLTGKLWVADVGQNRIEEVNVVEKGKNYGWNIMEGSACFSPPTYCSTVGLELPITEYTHSKGISITGGFVYRGTAIPTLVGFYVFGDFGSGRIWVVPADAAALTSPTEILDTDLEISSFGVDQNQELYITSFDGKLYTFQ